MRQMIIGIIVGPKKVKGKPPVNWTKIFNKQFVSLILPTICKGILKNN